MSHSKAFAPGREPFRDVSNLQLGRAHAPLGISNPTRAIYDPQPPKKVEGAAANDHGGLHTDTDTAKAGTPDYHFLWRSRDNRKGRHPIVINQSTSSTIVDAPRATSHPHEVLQVVLKMLTQYPVWDISWLVAYIFTLGSVVWCINGFFSFLPYIRPSSEFKGEVLDGGGITAIIGAILFFEIGSILLMFEAINENRAGCFGWAVESLFPEDDKQGGYRLTPFISRCEHHHQNRKNLVGKKATHHDPNMKPERSEPGKSWTWWPPRHSLRHHYIHELGFVASFAQFCGATVFGISGFTALPGIINKMSPGLTKGIYWTPQVVGGSGFIISGTLYMLETQSKWYLPAPRVLGWHIAFWNLLGGIGFTLCGALGFSTSHSAEYQAACSTFWGSFVSTQSQTVA